MFGGHLGSAEQKVHQLLVSRRCEQLWNWVSIFGCDHAQAQQMTVDAHA
jgi:hypothetical protein